MIPRAHLARGGVYLVLRQIAGTGLSLVAMFFVTRTIGAAAYGSFAATLVIVTLAHSICLLGIPVFLLRQATAPAQSDYDIAFTLTIMLGSAVTIAGLATSTVLETVTGLPGVGVVGAVMFLATLLVFAAAIPTVVIERSLDFRRIAAIELASQVANVAVSLPLAYFGARVWAPVAGWWAGLCAGTLLAFVFGSYRPRLRWQARRASEMLAFGIRFSASAWVFQLRQLFNPLLVGPFLGAEAVGVYALTARIIEALTFVKAIAWRMSLAAFGQMGGSNERIAAIAARGGRLQLLIILPLLLGFSLVGPRLVTLVLGRDWGATLALFPPLAMTAILGSAFTLQASALHVAGRSPRVAMYTAVQVVLLMSAGWGTIPFFGMTGIVLAEIAAFGAYPLLHRAMVDVYGPSRMTLTYVLGATGSIALYWNSIGLVAWLPLACVLLYPPLSKTLIADVSAALDRRRETPAAAQDQTLGPGKSDDGKP